MIEINQDWLLTDDEIKNIIKNNRNNYLESLKAWEEDEKAKATISATPPKISSIEKIVAQAQAQKIYRKIQDIRIEIGWDNHALKEVMEDMLKEEEELNG